MRSDQQAGQTFADALLSARDERREIPDGLEARPRFTLDEGYAIADVVHHANLERGWQQVGWKIGLTDPAMWVRLGADRPFYAPVYRETVVSGSLALAGLVQPRGGPGQGGLHDAGAAGLDPGADP